MQKILKQKMEETKKYPEVTKAVNFYISERSVPKTWFCGKLGIVNNTLNSRLENDEWKEVEILALKQLNIVK